MTNWKALAVLVAGLAAFGLGSAGPAALGFAGQGRAAESPAQAATQPVSEPISGPMYDVMKEEIPAEYADAMRTVRMYMERIKRIAPTFSASTVAIVQLRHSYGLRQAPDAVLIPLIESRIELLELLRTSDACGDNGLGVWGMYRPGDQNRDRIEKFGIALFRAAGAAARHPEPIERATRDDWARVVALFRQGGGSDSELAILKQGGVHDKARCPAAIRLFRAVLEIPGPAGRRVRAEVHGERLPEAFMADPAEPADDAAMAQVAAIVDDRFRGTTMVEAMKQEMPDEYADWLRKARPLIEKGVSPETLTTKMVTALFEPQHVSLVAEAPDALIVPVWKAHLALLEQVAPQATPEACGQFKRLWGSAPANANLSGIDALATGMFHAIGAERRSPRPVELSEEQDVLRVLIRVRELGGTIDDLKIFGIFGKANIADPRTCLAWSLFYRALLEMPGPDGARVRAEQVDGVLRGP